MELIRLCLFASLVSAKERLEQTEQKSGECSITFRSCTRSSEAAGFQWLGYCFRIGGRDCRCRSGQIILWFHHEVVLRTLRHISFWPSHKPSSRSRSSSSKNLCLCKKGAHHCHITRVHTDSDPRCPQHRSDTPPYRKSYPATHPTTSSSTPCMASVR